MANTCDQRRRDTYGVILRSKRQQVSTIDFGPLVGESLITGSAGKSFQISIGATLSTVWFNTGTRTAQAIKSSRVSVSNVYDTNGIASATASVIGSGASAAITLDHLAPIQLPEMLRTVEMWTAVYLLPSPLMAMTETRETAAGSTFPLPVYIVRGTQQHCSHAAIETALEGVGFVVHNQEVGLARDAATGLRFRRRWNHGFHP